MSRALRLRLSGDGDALRLQSVRPVDMLVPPSDPTQTSGESGFWVEIRDGENRTLYRKSLGSVLQDTIEVFSDDPKETIARRPSPPGPRDFVVIVPDTGERSAAVYLQNSVRGGPDPRPGTRNRPFRA